MKFLVTIFTIIVIWLGYSKLFYSDPFVYDKEASLEENIKILAFGDSLTRGTGAKIGYPERLSELLKIEVINEGIPGEVSKDGLKRLPIVLQNHKPDIVILCHGGNDILRRYDLAQTKQNLDSMIKLIQSTGAKVLLVGVPMFSGFSIDTAEFYDELAKEHSLIYAPNILAKIIKNPELKSDQVHPNDNGYANLALRLRALLLNNF